MIRPSKTLSPLASLALLVTALLAAGCGGGFATPLEEAEGDVLTSHADMMAYLEGLEAGTGAFTLDTIGTSVEGRSLVLLHFAGASPREEEPLEILVYAQQHGDEPSGKEAAIALARDIATGRFTDFLGSADLYLIPQVNPDGSEAGQRRNADGMDLNRDHLVLSTPEVSALHAVFNELMPHVTLDVHEYGITSSAWVDQGIRKDFGQQIGALSNANMSMAVRSYAWDRMIPAMKEALEPREVYLRRYLVTGGPDERFRFSTTALNDGRNSMGIYNTLSFLIEGQNGLTVEDDIRERGRQQLETMKAFITFAADHAGEIRELVQRERAALEAAEPGQEVALVMDYVPDPSRPTVTVGVIDMETGAEEELVIEDFHPRVEATVFVSRPMGYVVPGGLTSVLEVLARHGIEMRPVEAPLEAIVEAYTIRSTTETTKEDKDFLEVEVTKTRGPTVIPEGDVIVWTDQLRTNLIVSLLEPRSQWGLPPLPDFGELLEPGTVFPIGRIVEVEGRGAPRPPGL